MLCCRECNSEDLSVAGGGSGRTFVVRCRNPRCRAEYVTELSIARALAGLPRKTTSVRQPVARRADEYLDLE